MRAPLFLVIGFLAGVAISCGAAAPSKPPCAADNCAGCCSDSGDCLAGTAVFECGVGGAACEVCSANQVCNAGACSNFTDGDYDGSFPDAPDASVNRDAGTFNPTDGGSSGMDGGTVDAGPQDVSYSGQVQPIWDARCDACHSWSYDNIVGTNGRVVAGQPNSSTMYTRCLSGDMPRGSSPLTGTQLNLIRDWILNGAPRN